ncbi:CRISPR-associated ring nuclease Csm6 [Tolumonas auensis]|nr:CRISPR-associated ring nuclease Csm6 [Tolumonas auensis]
MIETVMKNILVAVTGASPQVLTETLYALYTQGKIFPQEVYVITTQNAKDILVEGLFHDGHWQRLITDYQMPAIKFDESHIWLIADDEGRVLDDAKAEADQTIMADFITRKTAELTADPDCSVHASLAGGRKTMAFYMGYAMSLYGREQDALSHVFVNDEFEFVKDFYYPTPYDNVITGKKPGDTVNTRDAIVTLAEIPFVRMRRHFEQDLLTHIQDASFSKTVALMNAAQQADHLDVAISYKARTVSVLGVDIKLSAKLLALYLMIAEQPNRTMKLSSAFQSSIEPTKQYLAHFFRLQGDVRVYNTFGLEDEGDWQHQRFEKLKPLTPKFIQEVLSQLHKKLAEHLPVEVVDKIKVHSDGAKGGSTYFINGQLIVALNKP